MGAIANMKNPQSVQQMVQRRVRRRRLWRRLRFAVLVVGVIVAAGGAAFGIDRMVVALRKYYASPAQCQQGRRRPHLDRAATTPASGPPHCVSGQLSGTVTNWQAISGTTFETVSLTNISLSPCTLLGYPGLAVNSANGTALPAATQDVPTMGASTGVGAATPTAVVVAPEGRAWFELSYPDVCDIILTPGSGTDGDTQRLLRGQVAPGHPAPRTSSPLLVPEPLRFTYGIAGFDVGPFGTGSPPPLPRS